MRFYLTFFSLKPRVANKSIYFFYGIYDTKDIKNLNKLLSLFFHSNVRKEYVEPIKYIDDELKLESVFHEINHIHPKPHKKEELTLIRDSDYLDHDQKLQQYHIVNREDLLYKFKYFHDLFLKDMNYVTTCKIHLKKILYFHRDIEDSLQKFRLLPFKNMQCKDYKNFYKLLEIKYRETLEAHFGNIPLHIPFSNFFTEIYDDAVDKYTLYEEIVDAKILIFCLTKEYVESNEFILNFKKAKQLNKIILLVQLEEFNIELNVLKNEFIYKIYKHKEYDYVGYITQNLLNMVENTLQKIPTVSVNV